MQEIHNATSFALLFAPLLSVKAHCELCNCDGKLNCCRNSGSAVSGFASRRTLHWNLQNLLRAFAGDFIPLFVFVTRGRSVNHKFDIRARVCPVSALIGFMGSEAQINSIRVSF